MDPRTLSIDDFDYRLPADSIALHPLEERDASRILYKRDGGYGEGLYRNLPALLPADSLLVFNDTQVIEARLLFRKESGGVVEVFLLEPCEGDVATALQSRGPVEWNCLVGGASKWKPGWQPQAEVETHAGRIRLQAEMRAKGPEGFRIRFQWNPADLEFGALLRHAGRMPLPPYLHREPEEADRERYQTVFARHAGSVAAPTAGLPFTERVLQGLEERGIRRAFVTLHVGAGTFRPVKAERMDGHDMHTEYMEVSAAAIEALRDHAGPVHAVGTTALRTLESLYWMGAKVSAQPATPIGSLRLSQWEPYDAPAGGMERDAALDALLGWLRRHGRETLVARTALIIAPGYRFRIAGGLVTNFHQPRSTLLLLVAAIVGDEWREMYAHALASGFRFLSYGDGCLLEMREQ